MLKKIFKRFSEVRRYDPTRYGLPEGFLLTSFTKTKGWGCKIDHESLLKMLPSIGGEKIMLDSPDCAFDQIKKDFHIVSTIDFFYPLVDDPYNQGKIGAANVLSDLYSVGIKDIRSVLMIISASSKMDKEMQLLVTSLMMKGFAEKVKEAGAKVNGGQSVINEVPMIGGSAIGIVETEIPYKPIHASAGDILVLTKPLGSQILVNVNQYFKSGDPKWNLLSKEKKLITEEQILDIYDRGVDLLARLNKIGSELMIKHGCTSSTDVTGFGILGHSRNLAEVQQKKVDYIIETLPSYPILHSLDKLVRDFKFKAGLAAETSGGLLISFPPEKVQGFINEMEKRGEPCWIVGKVTEGSNTARISESVKVIEV